LRPVAGDPNFDLAWRIGDVLYVAEIKSTTPKNAGRQLRLGLGQVLRYRHHLAHRTGGPVRAVLVAEKAVADPTWAAAAASLDVALISGPRIEADLAYLLDGSLGHVPAPSERAS
jgi:hypothetical protein